jgi:hypothetical protein
LRRLTLPALLTCDEVRQWTRCDTECGGGGSRSALSTWLNAGVDPTEVAERAGNSVEVLLTRYAKCLDGRQDVANRRIEDLLREYE